MSYFHYKNKAVFYEEFGEGPLLIMAHGNSASGRMFEPLFSLYEGYHAYASLNAYNMHLFPEGRHPCVLSNAEAFAKIVKEYLEDYSL